MKVRTNHDGVEWRINMTISRRNLLKTFAAISAIPFLNSQLVNALVDGDIPTDTYLLFHGMFFFEFDGTNLWIATPQHGAHQFYKRRHLQGFDPLQQGVDITFTTAEVGTGGKANSFPTEMLQFPKAILNKGNSVLSAVTSHYSRMKLPLPTNIFAYRTDVKSHFHPDTTKNSELVKAVLATAGPRVATITCLEYSKASGVTSPFVASFYAEHCEPPTNKQDVNNALKAAAVPGFLGSNFDLQMSALPNQLAAKDDSGSLPDGVNDVDEYEYSEFTQIHPSGCVHPLAPMVSVKSKQVSPSNAASPFAAADVASCPQFGLS